MEVGTEDEEEFWNCPVADLKQDEGKGFLDGHMQFTR
jgi:hypothetical protein